MNTQIILKYLIGAMLLSGHAVLANEKDNHRNHLLDGLAGRTFAVEAEIIYSADPEGTGFHVGDTFSNCYVFDKDNTWVDPLFPLPGMAVPGGWVQHTRGHTIHYTATVVDTVLAGAPLLTQTGIVSRTRGKSHDRQLTAYTTVWAGSQPFIEVASVGRQVSKREARSICPSY